MWRVCLQSAFDRLLDREDSGVQSSACPDTRLLARGVYYKHISGATTAIKPVLQQATELQFDIRARYCRVLCCTVPGGRVVMDKGSGGDINQMVDDAERDHRNS